MYEIVITFTMLEATQKRTRWPESLNAHSHTHEHNVLTAFSNYGAHFRHQSLKSANTRFMDAEQNGLLHTTRQSVTPLHIERVRSLMEQRRSTSNNLRVIDKRVNVVLTSITSITSYLNDRMMSNQRIAYVLQSAPSPSTEACYLTYTTGRSFLITIYMRVGHPDTPPILYRLTVVVNSITSSHS